MSLDKSIEHGKEHRREYYGSQRIDYTCRNHGSCPYCRRNRMFKKKKHETIDDKQNGDEILPDGSRSGNLPLYTNE